jgi:hypothetical protein
MTTPIFHDGFDHYGAPGGGAATGTGLQALLQQWWTSTSGTALTLVAGLSGTGYALRIDNTSTTPYRNFGSNYPRVVGTFRFASNLASQTGIEIRDGFNSQCAITVNSIGTISIRTGGSNGTAIATSTAAITANSVHVLSFDVAIGTAGAYGVYLDGVSILSGTGNTRGGTANNYTNTILIGGGSNGVFTYDDIAIIDGSVAFDAAIVTSNPRIETQVGSGDVQKQFPSGATILGAVYSTTNNSNAPGANQLFLRRFIPETNETINSVSTIPAVTSGTVKFKACLYADNAGSPNGQARLSDGTEVIGSTGGSTVTSALVTPTALVAGTAYWIGFITDTSIALGQNDTGTTAVRAAATYTSGVPATCPTVTTGQANWIIWGNCSGAAANWPALKQPAAPGDVSYVGSSTVGDEDLLSFPALSTNPTTIFFGAVMANVKRTDAGARTIDIHMKSGSSDGTGSAAPQSPALSYGWLNSYFPLDPSTGIAWTPSGWNGASAGYKIAA